MRSAVSVILSSPPPDPNMSRPDYEQTIHDHAAILILVRHLGTDCKIFESQITIGKLTAIVRISQVKNCRRSISDSILSGQVKSLSSK